MSLSKVKLYKLIKITTYYLSTLSLLYIIISLKRPLYIVILIIVIYFIIILKAFIYYFQGNLIILSLLYIIVH
jgi:hypothetical protein